LNAECGALLRRTLLEEVLLLDPPP